MTIVDANILVYAYNSDAPQQRLAAKWLSKLFAGSERIALPWVTLWAFIRISTNPRLWANPRSAGDAFGIVNQWLELPGVILLEPGPLHSGILEKLVTGYAVSGPMVSDAVLAALALEFGATLASADQDFRHFRDLRWINPLDG